MAGLLGEGQGLLQAPAPVDPFGGYQGLLSANQAATVPGSGLLGNAQRTHARMQEQPMLHRAALASMPIPVVGDVLGLANDAAWMIADPERRTWLDFLGAGLGALPFVPSAAMTVFHGSPHLFKELPGAPFGKIDHAKMGTGEGAQARGWGTYLAEKKGTAGTYKLAGRGGYLASSQANLVQDAMGQAKIHQGGEDFAKQWLHDAAMKTDPSFRQKYWDALNNFDDLKGINPEGHLYTVDLPDEQIDKMLDLDAPLSEQPAIVRKLLRSTRAGKKGGPPNPNEMSEEQLRTTLEKIDPSGNYRFWEDSPNEKLTKADLIEQWEMTREYDPEGFDSYFGSEFLDDQPGHGILQQIEAEVGSPEKASKLLLKAGIPGAKFYDAGSRTAVKGAAEELPGFRASYERAKKAVESATSPMKKAEAEFNLKERANALEMAEARAKGTRNYVVFDESVMTVIGRE